MDNKLKEIYGTAQELDITGKFILKRLAQVLDQPEKLDINCQCESASLLQESHNEVDKLKDRIAELERLEKEKEDTLKASLDELKRLEAKFDQLHIDVDEHTLAATGSVNMKMSPGRDKSDNNGEKSNKHDESTSATGKLKTLQDNKDTKKGPEDNLKLGGPSPLSAGITFAMEGIGRPHCGSVSVKDIHQGVKLILLTDGEASEPFVYAGPDECLDQEMAKASVIDAFSKLEPVSGEVELYTVPVGKANTEILELGTSIAEGKILDYKSGRQFSRRLYLMLKRNPYSSVCLTHDELLTAEDLKDMGEILKENEAIQKKLENRLNLEVEGSNLPKLGSRVRRGPDWEYGNQDDSGPGTVISHTPNGEKCFVNWDNNNHTDVYKYGAEGKYDILLTGDVRQLQPGETIAIGCTVKIGSGWNSDNTEIDQTNVGTVINLRLKATPTAMVKATVKWDNGLRGEYRYDETPEIVVCDPATGETSDISTGASSNSSGTSDSPGGASNMSRSQHISRPSFAKPMKNKNKNKQ